MMQHKLLVRYLVTISVCLAVVLYATSSMTRIRRTQDYAILDGDKSCFTKEDNENNTPYLDRQAEDSMSRTHIDLEYGAKEEVWFDEQNKRKHRVKEMCGRYNEMRKREEEKTGKIRAIRGHTKAFIYNEEYKLFNCLNSKVGTTSINKQFVSLDYVNLDKNPHMNKKESMQQMRGHSKSLYAVNNQSLPALAQLAGDSVSFSFVRHPFERLVSSYQNQIVDLKARDILQLQNYDPEEMTFTMFVTALIEEHKHICKYWWSCTLNCHVLPEVSRCDYCNIPYRYIGKMESWSADMSNIMSQAGIDYKVEVKGMNVGSGNTTTLANKYISSLPDDIRHKLYMAYRMDFDLFGYKP